MAPHVLVLMVVTAHTAMPRTIYFSDADPYNRVLECRIQQEVVREISFS